ncbi:MAG: lipoate--protein ligase [Acetivibrionales bacterium]|jgi:lipoate-protein ligase A
MKRTTRIIRTESVDPWWNLAIEEYLLERVEPGQCILYLWQNENTVVIGKNQNPWRECKTELLEKEGGKLARRISGGGAVYHDLGNLNFTFVAGEGAYDQDKQTGVILDAVRRLGIFAEKTGRNDIAADGRKFSGNAFCFRSNGAFHHGTLLISTDMEKLSRYLQVSKEKMRSKGIKSVQSRVVNLSDLKPGFSVADMTDAMIASFREAYGSDADVEDDIREGKEARAALEELYCKYSSWAWRYGETPSFDVDIETRFSWGGVQLGFKLEKGVVREAKAYSDAMDTEFITRLPDLFTGCPFNSRQLSERLREAAGECFMENGGRRQMIEDLAGWLTSKGF